MQNLIVLAFRKRLKNRGYTKVSILQIKNSKSPAERYLIRAVEPLAGTLVERKCGLAYMSEAFRF